MAGPSSVIGVQAIRVARLTTGGIPDFGNPLGGFLLCGGVSKFEHDFEIQAGQDIFEEDAAGNPCVVRRKPDKTKFATFTLTMCRTDYRLSEILGVSEVVTAGQIVVGHAIKTNFGCGTTVVPAEVSVELWSEQVDCDAPHAQPYQRAILPRCTLAPKGFTRENGVSLPVYTGIASGSNGWGDGPFGDADVMAGHTGYCYAEIDDFAVPACAGTIGYINVPGSAS